MSDKKEEQNRQFEELFSHYEKEISEKLRKIDPALVAELRFSINKDHKLAAIYKKGNEIAEAFGDVSTTWNGSWGKVVINPPQPGHEGPTQFGDGFRDKIKTMETAEG